VPSILIIPMRVITAEVVLFVVTMGISCTHCEIRTNEISAKQCCAASKKPDVAIALDFVYIVSEI